MFVSLKLIYNYLTKSDKTTKTNRWKTNYNTETCTDSGTIANRLLIMKESSKKF